MWPEDGGTIGGFARTSILPSTMPVAVTFPGVYVEESPGGNHTITSVATATTAFAGRTCRGPVDEPVSLFSFGDYERFFGGLAGDYPLGCTVQDFFLHGGSQAIVVRLFETEEPTDCAQTAPNPLPLEASNPGIWGRDLIATIDREGLSLWQPADPIFVERYGQHGLQPDDLFNLTISFQTPDGNVTTERFLNLSTRVDGRTATAPGRYDRVLADQSLLVRMPAGTDLASIGPVREGTIRFDGQSGADSHPLSVATYLGDAAGKTGLHALDKTDLFNLLCLPPDQPGGDTDPAVYAAAAALCRERRAFLIADPPVAWAERAKHGQISAIQPNDPALGIGGEDSRYAAVYFPRVLKTGLAADGKASVSPACGVVAGVMAATDAQRGVWKAPAGLDAGIKGIADLEVHLTDTDGGLLNPIGINCLRTFSVVGPVVWGARTLRGADVLADDYKYVPVRRLTNYIEESLYRGTRWVVFEPNDERLWSALRLEIGNFMADLAHQGAFYNYNVACDHSTTTPDDIARGVVNILVSFAPVRPAEFIVLTIQQRTGSPP